MLARVEERDPTPTECVTARAKQDDTRVSSPRGRRDWDRNGHDRTGNLGATCTAQHCLRNCAMAGREITAKKNALAANKITARPSQWSLLRLYGWRIVCFGRPSTAVNRCRPRRLAHSSLTGVHSAPPPGLDDLRASPAADLAVRTGRQAAPVHPPDRPAPSPRLFRVPSSNCRKNVPRAQFAHRSLLKDGRVRLPPGGGDATVGCRRRCDRRSTLIPLLSLLVM